MEINYTDDVLCLERYCLCIQFFGNDLKTENKQKKLESLYFCVKNIKNVKDDERDRRMIDSFFPKAE